MKIAHALILAAATLFGASALSAQTLYNLQLNGNESGTYSGAAQVGTAGDTWNNPVWGGVSTGSTTLFSGQTLVDSTGADNGVTATLTANYNNNTSAWNDGGVFNRYTGQTAGSATTGLMDYLVKVDYSGTVNVLYLSISGLPADRNVTVYGYGAGNGSGQGANWALDAANGGDAATTEYDGSATGRDVTLAGSEGISWASMSGITDGSGNLLITATGNAPLGIWWQTYTNGLQIVVESSPGLPETTQNTTVFPSDDATGVNRDTNLRITFDGGAPQVGISGTISIYRSSDDALMETIDLASTSNLSQQSIDDATAKSYRYLQTTIEGTSYMYLPIIIDGNTAIISLSSASLLSYGQSYYVNIDSGVILDSDGNTFPAISDKTTWNFTVKASGPNANATEITVNNDGTGDFTTVQGAIEFVPTSNTFRRTIFIEPGDYFGYAVAKNRPFITLGGTGSSNADTRIAYLVNNNVFNLISPGPSTLAPRGVMCADGADDMIVSNLTIQNLTADGGSQAEAFITRPSTDRAFLFNVQALSYQDTLLLDGDGYFLNCFIEGDVDFIWGTGADIFENCEIKAIGQYNVNCQSRTQTSGDNGFIFVGCNFTAAASLSDNSCPMNRINQDSFPNCMVVLIDCALDTHTTNALWQLDGSGSTSALRLWEYQSTDLSGTLLNVTSRPTYNHMATGVGGSTVLDNQQIDQATADYFRDPANVFGWTPSLPVVPGGYTNFISGAGLSLSSQGAFADDTDSDGIANILEYVLWGSPSALDAGSVIPVLTRGSGDAQFTFNTPAALDAQIGIVLETSPDLITWTTLEDGVNGVSIVETPIDANSSQVTVTITSPGNTLYARVNAVTYE